MKNIAFGAVGILLCIVLTKSEFISWFRLHEMFRFENFHLYGVLFTAVILSAIIAFVMKKSGMKTLTGATLSYQPMKFRFSRHILAGTLFGLGWALAGACPGPMFVLLGNGYWIFLLIILGALAGTFTYGLVKNRLPH